MVLDLYCTGFRWFCKASSWLALSFLWLMLTGAVVSNRLEWACTSYILIWVVFLLRLYNICRGQLSLAPFDSSDINRLRSVHFIWVNRTVQDMEWFITELEQIHSSDNIGIFSFELYCTRESVASLHEAMAAHPHLRAVFHAGRPQWPQVFSTLRQSRYDTVDNCTVGIFYCGSVAMGRAIRASALEASDCPEHGKLENYVRYVFKMENF